MSSPENFKPQHLELIAWTCIRQGTRPRLMDRMHNNSAPARPAEVSPIISTPSACFTIFQLLRSNLPGHLKRWKIHYRLTQYGAEQSGQPGIDKPLTAEQQRIRTARQVVCKASVHLKAAFISSHQSYGSRRLVAAMANAGFRIGRYKVRSLMRKVDAQGRIVLDLYARKVSAGPWRRT